MLKSRSIFHLIYTIIFTFSSLFQAKARKGGFIDYAIPNIVYVYVLPSLIFFLQKTRRKYIFRFVHFLITRKCSEYYLFNDGIKRFFPRNSSRLVCSLTVRLEVLSLCGTITDLSKLVRSKLDKKETRVSIHPRSGSWRWNQIRISKLNQAIRTWVLFLRSLKQKTSNKTIIQYSISKIRTTNGSWTKNNTNFTQKFLKNRQILLFINQIKQK